MLSTYCRWHKLFALLIHWAWSYKPKLRHTLGNLSVGHRGCGLVGHFVLGIPCVPSKTADTPACYWSQISYLTHTNVYVQCVFVCSCMIHECLNVTHQTAVICLLSATRTADYDISTLALREKNAHENDRSTQYN